MDAHQRHEGFIAEQQGGQRIHALEAEQRLQPIEQDILHIGAHRPLASRAVSLLQQGHAPDALQKVEKIIQHRPFIQAVDPIALLLPVQPPRNPGIITPGDLPTPPLGHVLGDLVLSLSLRPPPSMDPVFAREESGCRIKAWASVGISVPSLYPSIQDIHFVKHRNLIAKISRFGKEG
jgi:hypothetical protein